jgi:hypothetical protein
MKFSQKRSWRERERKREMLYFLPPRKRFFLVGLLVSIQPQDPHVSMLPAFSKNPGSGSFLEKIPFLFGFPWDPIKPKNTMVMIMMEERNYTED